MVPMRQIRAVAEQIARRFKPRKIILFGSYAYGTPTTDSDVDLFVLMRDVRGRDHELDIRTAIDFPFPTDIIVRSPKEFKQRIGWGDQFLREIRDKGKVLYESADARMGAQSRRRLRQRAA